MSQNSDHYSGVCLKRGPEYIIESYEQAAKIHYNPLVNFDDTRFKYGVISTKDLIQDL